MSDKTGSASNSRLFSSSAHGSNAGFFFYSFYFLLFYFLPFGKYFNNTLLLLFFPFFLL